MCHGRTLSQSRKKGMPLVGWWAVRMMWISLLKPQPHTACVQDTSTPSTQSVSEAVHRLSWVQPHQVHVMTAVCASAHLSCQL